MNPIQRKEHVWDTSGQKCIDCGAIRHGPVGDRYSPSSCPKEFHHEPYVAPRNHQSNAADFNFKVNLTTRH